MGAIRGKRNRDQDRYWHERRKATQAGMTSASLEASALCMKCGALTLRAEMHKGWCVPCVALWVGTTDPWLIYQAQSHLPSGVVPVSRMKQIERLQEKVIEPISDDAFLPLTRFMGARGVGSQRTWWNVLQAAYEMELSTTAQIANVGHNTMHLCGRHAPVQRLSLQGFLSRIFSSRGEFKLFTQDARFRDYWRGFINDNRLLIFTYKQTSVDVYDRAATLRMEAKFGKIHFDKHTPAYWPFESEHAGKSREAGRLEELPDHVMEIGKLVAVHSMPESLREDLCQDLVVAVLTGEATLDQLRHEATMRQYVREAFRHHPLKYGHYSLDRVANPAMFGGVDSSKSEWVTGDDISPDRADRGWLEALCVDPDERHGWHEGRDREKGIATLGEIARDSNEGHAIKGGPNPVRTPDDIDEEIAEVFFADSHPQWRRKLSD